MTHSISRDCPACKKFTRVIVEPKSVIACGQCAREWGKAEEISEVLSRCPICACRQFYLQKDFNQALGCGVMLIGIILVPVTYGLSLPFFSLLDWILYKRVADVVVCYKCLSEFRGFAIPSHIKPFMHHIGAKYDQK